MKIAFISAYKNNMECRKQGRLGNDKITNHLEISGA